MDNEVLQEIKNRFHTEEIYEYCKKRVLSQLKEQGIIINNLKQIDAFLDPIWTKFYVLDATHNGVELNKSKNAAIPLDNYFTEFDDYDDIEPDTDRTLVLHDCRCMILQKNGYKHKPLLIVSYLEKQKDVLNILKYADKLFSKILETKKVQKMLEEGEEEMDKKQISMDKQHKIAVKNGLYTMLTDDYQNDCAYWRILTKCSGFRGGELITLAYTNDVPSYPLAMKLFLELNQVVNYDYKKKNKDVLFLSASPNKSFLLNVYNEVANEYSLCDEVAVNNIHISCANVHYVQKYIETYKPKILVIDNFQMLDGPQGNNAEALSRLCRQHGVCIILLYEINNVKPGVMPDITKIKSNTKIADRSDKIFMLWNPQFDWYNKINGKKHEIHSIVCDLVKNRQSKLIREFLFFTPFNHAVEAPTDAQYQRLMKDLTEKYYKKEEDDRFDAYSIADAVRDLKNEVSNSKPFMVLKSGIII